MRKNYNGDFMKEIEDILSHSTLKHSLAALKEFKTAVSEAGFPKDEVADIVKHLATAIFFLHFNLLPKE